MPNDWFEITLRIHEWLERNNIDSEGATIEVWFPDRRRAFEAECCFKRDLAPMHLTQADFTGSPRKVNGLGLEFKHGRKP